MSRADVAFVAQRILPDGVRPDENLIIKIEEAIDKTSIEVNENASYSEILEAKLKNEDDAVALLQDPEPTKAKAKTKAKPK